MSENREHSVTEAFVALANSLVDEFDVVELLNTLTTQSARLLDVASAGLLLADAHGVLHVVAASSERTRHLELYQLQRDEGPCLECYRTGLPVSVPNLGKEMNRWSHFVPAAQKAGFASVHALPMRILDDRLGALGLFGSDAGELNEEDLNLGQALAHVASVAIIAGGATTDPLARLRQLQNVFSGRAYIEQAKGILAQLGGLAMEESFAALRRYAIRHNERLSSVAQRPVARQLSGREILMLESSSKADLP